MFIDTHCHLNAMVKDLFDRPLTRDELLHAQKIVEQAAEKKVTTIINVGTSLIESVNSIELARQSAQVFAVVGIHPNDLTSSWRDDFHEIKKLFQDTVTNKIVGIGECGLDFHYPDYDKLRQVDAFKMQIELALEHDLALVVHTRDAGHETLEVLDEYSKQLTRVIIHCFSEDRSFAQQIVDWKFCLGIGGTITYPKNNELRDIVSKVPQEFLVLETDAPFLPVQTMRGKKNSPEYIPLIAEYIAQLRSVSFELIGQQTTLNARGIFKL